MHSVSEEDFNVAWETLNRMINIIKTDYSQNDLSYEELILKKELEASY
jgi:hypothetical protein